MKSRGGFTIECRNLSIRFEAHRKALEDINLTFRPGELTWLVGPSGAGKTSLMRLIMGHEVPETGDVLVNRYSVFRMSGRELAAYRRRIGWAQQKPDWFASKPLLQNLLYPAEIAGKARTSATRQRLQMLLDAVGMRHKLSQYPYDLSAGEQQRAALVRALINRPSLLVLDEPTAHVGRAHVPAILRLLEEARASGTTVICATHDSWLIEHGGTRLITIEDGHMSQDLIRGGETAHA